MNVASVMAHQDDELMCLGTMLKMKQRGAKLHFIVLTDGSAGMAHRPDTPREEAARIRDQEMRALADGCGATYTCLGEQDIYLYDTPDVRLRLLNALRACQADVIFTHFSPDYNVDHMTVTVLVRHCAMQMPYRPVHTEAEPTAGHPAVFLVEPSGGFEFEPTHYVDIGDVLAAKMELVRCHKSQDEAFRAGLKTGLADWVMGVSARRGEPVGVAHAEAFRPMLARRLIKAYSVLP